MREKKLRDPLFRPGAPAAVHIFPAAAPLGEDKDGAKGI